MAYTADDLAALKAAIATGALKVRYADGREVTYRSLAEMKQVLADIAGEVNGTGVRSLSDDRVVTGVRSGFLPPLSGRDWDRV